jgi:V/A-type H+-transporting ATPase subunit I
MCALKAERMRRVLIVGTKDALPKTVDTLYATGTFHVVDFNERGDAIDIGSPLPGSESASSKLLKMMAVSKNLGLADESGGVGGRLPVERVRQELDGVLKRLEGELESAVQSRKDAESLLSEKRAELAALAPYHHVDFPLSSLRGHGELAIFHGKFRSDPEQGLAAVTDSYDIVRGDATIVLVDKKVEREASEILSKCGFTELPLPSSPGVPSDEARRLGAEIAILERDAQAVKARIAKLRAENDLFVLASMEELSITANKAETPLRFGAGRHSFLVDGWVPDGKLEALRARLSSCPDGVVDVLDLGWSGDEEPPIRLNNPAAARPIEMLIEMFSLPKYSEIDPTVLMLATFPIFYGLMLGDWGYGIVLVALSLSGAFAKLMGKLGMSGGAPGLSKILLYCGITSIAFGLIYDEFFGFELLHGWDLHFELLGIAFPVYRGEESMVGKMLIFCVYVGVVHLFIGYGIGLYNVRAEHGLKTAILEKGGWILTLVGLVVVLVTALNENMLSGGDIPLGNPMLLAGIATIIAGVIMTAMVEKINGILELPGLASNLLSYTRIFAIGLSSIGIALAFNEEMAMPAIESGGLGVVIGVLILILGHALNIALGIIGPLIQSLRLHYVEFFTKFYRGGGVKFNPLGIRRKHTKEA